MPSPLDLILVRTSRTDDTVGAISKRLDRLEHTLNTMLAILDRIEAQLEKQEPSL